MAAIGNKLWLAAALAFSGQLFIAAQPSSTPAARFVVVLDAGHGGSDSGASLTEKSISLGKEKDAALAFSERLRSLLAARGMEVVTTRAADVDVNPDRRAEIANQAKAQACLSLHATMSGAGVHLYPSSLAAAGNTPVPIPWKTAQAPWVEQSLTLAGVLDSALTHAGIPVIAGRTALPAIDSMACPAVAVEIAPLSAADRSQGNSPTDPAYQARVAEALAAALVEWRTEAHKP